MTSSKSSFHWKDQRSFLGAAGASSTTVMAGMLRRRSARSAPDRPFPLLGPRGRVQSRAGGRPGEGEGTVDGSITRGWRVLAVVPFVAALGLTAVACQPTTTITVSTAADGHDVVPGDGVCEVSAGAGDCSLRAAVEEAGASTNAVHISVPAGTYTTGALGPLALRGPTAGLTVQADGSGPAVVDASGAAADADAIDAHVSSSIVGLTVRGAPGSGVSVVRCPPHLRGVDARPGTRTGSSPRVAARSPSPCRRSRTTSSTAC